MALSVGDREVRLHIVDEVLRMVELATTLRDRDAADALA
jgi:hypothetical protein